MSLNKVMLIGHLGKDPEIRSTQDGRKIANFSVATTERWKDKNSGERKEKTEWHRCVVFNEALAGIVEKYLHKGSKIYVEGQLQTRKWTDKDDVERYSTEVVLQGYSAKIEMLDGKRDGGDGARDESAQSGSSSGGGHGGRGKPGAPPDLDDEIPF